MKLEDHRNTLVKIKDVTRAGDSLYVNITGLVLPEFERKDPNIARSFQCVAHERNNQSGQYVLHLLLTDPEPREIMVSTWYEDYKKILET